MMIALPNGDGSFTATLFMKFEGEENSFESLKNDDQIQEFYKKQFPTAYEIMPQIVSDHKKNKTSSLNTVKCYPWAVPGKILLIGDAAHAIVPFYGQGMNCAFEDVFVLDQILQKQMNFNQKIDWKQTSQLFQSQRKPDTDSIAELAVDNL
jgi:kynurenine 3-monooxygenase